MNKRGKYILIGGAVVLTTFLSIRLASFSGKTLGEYFIDKGITLREITFLVEDTVNEVMGNLPKEDEKDSEEVKTASLIKRDEVKLYPFRSKNGRVGYYDEKFNHGIEPRFAEGRDFYYGYAIVKENGVYGVINEEGKYLIKPSYENISDFSEGYAVGHKRGKDYIINYKGEEKEVENRYDYISNFIEDRAVVIKGNKYGAIDTEGKEVVETKYSEMEDYFWGTSTVMVPEEYNPFRIDKWGKKIDEEIGEKYQVFNNNMVVKNDNKIYDYHKNKLDIAKGYKAITINEELIICKDKKNKVGALNKKGEIILPFEYDSLGIFHNGYANCKKDGKSYIINKKGEEVFEIKDNYVFTEVMSDSFLYVLCNDDKVRIYNLKSGKLLMTFNHLDPVLINNRFIVKYEEDFKTGKELYNSKMEKILDEKFIIDSAHYGEQNSDILKIVKEDGTEVYINSAGEERKIDG